VLVALALVPTIIHAYAGVVVDDGLRASMVPESLAGFDSRASERSENWGERRFESHDWVERVFVTPNGEVPLTIVRSYDLKALYHHPELAVAYGTDFQRARVEPLPGQPDIPMHVLETVREGGPAAFYVLHYDGRFINDPIRFQVRTASELLFGGRQAMTLFFVQSPGLRASTDPQSRPSIALLRAAIQHFIQSGPPAS
jgi:hypothetical protein